MATFSISPLDPFMAAVPFWGQSSQFPSGLSQKRDCGLKTGNFISVIIKKTCFYVR